MSKIVDLSHVIEPGKAGRKFSLEMVGAETVNPNVIRLENQWYIMHNISMVSHIATHIEAPYHILKDQADLATLPLETLMGPAVILDLRGCAPESPPSGSMRCEAPLKRREGSARATSFSATSAGAPFYGTEQYGQSPYFPPETIGWLADQGMKLMGVDAGGVEVPGSEEHVSHHALFQPGDPADREPRQSQPALEVPGAGIRISRCRARPGGVSGPCRRRGRRLTRKFHHMREM